MASGLGPTPRMQYNQPNSPSTTNLLTPSGGPGVQAALSRGPKLRSMASDMSLVSEHRWFHTRLVILRLVSTSERVQVLRKDGLHAGLTLGQGASLAVPYSSRP